MSSPTLTKIQSWSVSEWETQTSGLALTVTLVNGKYLWIEQGLDTTDVSVTPQLAEMTVERAEGAGTIIVIDPDAGEYLNTQTITLSTNNLDGTIYYTIDGSDPDNASIEYTGPFPAGNFTVKAIVYEAGVAASGIFSAVYTIENDTVSFSHDSGIYKTGTEIVLSTNNPDLDIYYTIDGSDPDETDIAYTEPIAVNDFTVKAVAYFNGQINSEIASETYTVREAFQKWRVLLPTFNGSDSYWNSAGMEWFFYNKNQAELDFSTATVTSSGDNSGYGVERLWDRTTSYHRFADTGLPCWIEIDFNIEQDVASIVFQASTSTYAYPYMFSSFTLQYDSTGSGDWVDYYSDTGLTWTSGELKEYVLQDGIFNPPAKVDSVNIEAALAISEIGPPARVRRQWGEVALAQESVPASVNVTKQFIEIVASGSSANYARTSSQIIEVTMLKKAEVLATSLFMEVAILVETSICHARATNTAIEAACHDRTNEGRISRQTIEVLMSTTSPAARTTSQSFEVALAKPITAPVRTTSQTMEIAMSGDSASVAKTTQVCVEAICFYFRLMRSTIEIWRNTPNTVVWSGGEIEYEGVTYKVEPGHYVLPEIGVEYHIYWDPEDPYVLKVSDNYEEIALTKELIQSVESDGTQIVYEEYQPTAFTFPISDAAIISWKAGKLAYNGVVYDIDAGQFAFPEANVAYYIYFSPEHPNTLQVASEADFVLSGNAILAIVYLHQTAEGTEILMESRIAEKPCIPTIGAYIGTLEVLGMYVGDLRVAYPGGIDPCGALMGSDCCKIIARSITHMNDEQNWYLTPYKFSGPLQSGAKWQLFEWGMTPYSHGDVNPGTGELIGLPDYFRSSYAYEGHMALVVCTNVEDAAYLYEKAIEIIPDWESDEEHCVSGIIVT